MEYNRSPLGYRPPKERIGDWKEVRPRGGGGGDAWQAGGRAVACSTVQALPVLLCVAGCR